MNYWELDRSEYGFVSKFVSCYFFLLSFDLYKLFGLGLVIFLK